MKDRIKKIRKDAGLTQAEFGDMIGATRPMVTSYELGKVIPDASKRMLICEKFNVNLDWLERGGDQEPYKPGLIPRLAIALRNAPAIAAALENLTARMTLDDWKVLNSVVEKAIQSQDEPHKDAPRD